jgi:hypothetical protein
MTDKRDGRHGHAEAVQDLKATSDSIRADAGRLAEIEDLKEALSPEDPETDRLSAEAVDLAQRIEREAKAEQEIAREMR